MEREKAIIELEMKELISRHRTDMTEKIARLSQAEERLIINMSRMDQRKQENEELMANLQNAIERKQASLNNMSAVINHHPLCRDGEGSDRG